MLGVVQSVLKSSRYQRYDDTKVAVRRYNHRLRHKVWKFATAGPRHADVVETFPAAAIAIASRPADDPGRIAAIRVIEDGGRLPMLARSLHMPLWLRRLPPEAFAAPLPRDLSPHWFDETFAARILNELPPETERTARWFQALVQAEEAGGPGFSAWVASLRVFTTRRPPPVPIPLLAMYAWYSGQTGLPGGQLVHSPWNEKMGLGRAAALTREWAMRALQDFCLEPEMFKDIWCRGRVVGAFEIVPLITASSLHDEALVLRNCLRRYVPNVAYGHSHIYSVRCNGVRLAAMEVRRSDTTGLPRIVQICGVLNSKPPQEAIDAASGWLMLQLRDSEPQPKLCPPRHSDALFLRDIWGPYERARCMDIGARFKIAPPQARTLLKELSTMAMLDRY